MSNNGPKERPGLLGAEGRRVLSLLEGRPLKENEIERDGNGRPFIPGSRMDFNISHSGAMDAVSMLKGEVGRTGCDIQIARPKPGLRKIALKEIAGDFFTAPEKRYVFSPGGGQSEENRFYEIWALRESCLKLRGLSVFEMASLPSFIGGQGQGQGHFSFDETVSSPLSFYLYELGGETGDRYYLAAALEGEKQSQPEIRWFSESFLPCRSIAEIKATLSPASTVRPKM